MSMIIPGATVGKSALVGAHSSVSRDVAPDTVVAGSTAKLICETAKIKLKSNPDVSAYHGAGTSIADTLSTLLCNGKPSSLIKAEMAET